ncbi:rod shape-determining protein [Planococcus salinarum]|uniref:Cell shape-determining protein MreB n=1 Tax=Planococcus salinarum TaxID=622695 RepID=A0ABX3CYM1_9BACL|nr:rod shape-determining protein [Planococcus salinarum]OHX50564.1 rod shape-determining protein [Planococcus salinarum]TAA73330.1 rod shape-determining protein [Planococcus salinarum]
MFNFGAREVGIDLGTANTLFVLQNQGIVLREPSMVAVDGGSDEMIAAGTEAFEMNGRTPVGIRVSCPIHWGVIADQEAAMRMMSRFLKELSQKVGSLKRKIFVISVPVGITTVEKRAILEAAEQVGARETLTIEEPLAAAIGARMPVWEPEGMMVVDIGGGSTEMAVISSNGIAVSQSLKTAGHAMDRKIAEYILKTHSLKIGMRTAEHLKIRLGTAYGAEGEKRLETLRVGGSDLLAGHPKIIEITARDIEGALAESVTGIINGVKRTLEITPPELAADLCDRGIVLTGGGSLLHGLDKKLAAEIGVPVTLADHPMDCVALGTEKALHDLDSLRQPSW